MFDMADYSDDDDEVAEAVHAQSNCSYRELADDLHDFVGFVIQRGKSAERKAAFLIFDLDARMQILPVKAPVSASDLAAIKYAHESTLEFLHHFQAWACEWKPSCVGQGRQCGRSRGLVSAESCVVA